MKKPTKKATKSSSSPSTDATVLLRLLKDKLDSGLRIQTSDNLHLLRLCERQQREIDSLRVDVTALKDSNGPMWTTSSGITLRMRDMTDSHLANAIAFLSKPNSMRKDSDRGKKLADLLEEKKRRRIMATTEAAAKAAEQLREAEDKATEQLDDRFFRHLPPKMGVTEFVDAMAAGARVDTFLGHAKFLAKRTTLRAAMVRAMATWDSSRMSMSRESRAMMDKLLIAVDKAVADL